MSPKRQNVPRSIAKRSRTCSAKRHHANAQLPYLKSVSLALASGDVSLGAAVTEKCEGDFLGKLSPKQKRVYNREQQSCARKYQKEDGSTYRSFEAFCGAYVARNYSTQFLKAAHSRRK